MILIKISLDYLNVIYSRSVKIFGDSFVDELFQQHSAPKWLTKEVQGVSLKFIIMSMWFYMTLKLPHVMLR